jgi:hypothetical protein
MTTVFNQDLFQSISRTQSAQVAAYDVELDNLDAFLLAVLHTVPKCSSRVQFSGLGQRTVNSITRAQPPNVSRECASRYPHGVSEAHPFRSSISAESYASIQVHFEQLLSTNSLLQCTPERSRLETTSARYCIFRRLILLLFRTTTYIFATSR